MAGIVAGNPLMTVVVTIAPGLTPDAQVFFPAISPIGQMLARLFPADIAIRHASDVANNLPERISLAQWAVARLFLARCNLSDDFAIHPAKPSPLNASFTAAFWSRVLSHLVDLGLLQPGRTHLPPRPNRGHALARGQQ